MGVIVIDLAIPIKKTAFRREKEKPLNFQSEIGGDFTKLHTELETQCIKPENREAALQPSCYDLTLSNLDGTIKKKT